MLSEQSLSLYCQAFMLQDGLGLDDWTLLNIIPEVRGQSILLDLSFRKMQICVESILLCHHLSFQSGWLRYDTVAALLGATLYIAMNLNGFLLFASALPSPHLIPSKFLELSSTVLHVEFQNLQYHSSDCLNSVLCLYSQQACYSSRAQTDACCICP